MQSRLTKQEKKLIQAKTLKRNGKINFLSCKQKIILTHFNAYYANSNIYEFVKV